MQGQMFGRLINVFIGNASIKNFASELRINFDVLKTNTNVANKATISIYNLNEENRNNINTLDDLITVYAGYSEDMGARLVFSGNILRVNHAYQFPDIITKIEAGDGIRELRDTRAALSFEEKTKAITVLQSVAQKFGLPIKDLPSNINGEYLNGFSHAGSIKKALDTVCNRFKLEWSVQDGRIQIIQKGAVSKSPPAIINTVEGLLEKVELVGDIQEFLTKNVAQESPILKIKCLLNPEITPGGSVALTVPQFPGLYKVRQVQHQGDNFDGDFITTAQIQRITGDGLGNAA